MFFALLLTAGFMIAEAVGGVLAGSLALLADAGHMLADAAALALALFAFRLAHKPADVQRSYGYHRFQVLVAFVNGLTLFVVAAWIVVEAVERLREPVPVLAGPMLMVALIGLAINVVVFAILHRGDRKSINLRGATMHVLGDLMGSVAALVAAGGILWTGWAALDPLLSVLVALLILRGAWMVVRDSGHILLEGTPENIHPVCIGGAVRALPGVVDVHHVHAWSLTGERPLVTLHVVVEPGTNQNELLSVVNRVLYERFGVEHTTVQVEHRHERQTCIHP